MAETKQEMIKQEIQSNEHRELGKCLKFGIEAEEYRKQIKNISGVAGFFRDPDGMEKKQLEVDLKTALFRGALCVSEAKEHEKTALKVLSSSKAKSR